MTLTPHKKFFQKGKLYHFSKQWQLDLRNERFRDKDWKGTDVPTDSLLLFLKLGKRTERRWVKDLDPDTVGLKIGNVTVSFAAFLVGGEILSFVLPPDKSYDLNRIFELAS